MRTTGICAVCKRTVTINKRAPLKLYIKANGIYFHKACLTPKIKRFYGIK